MECLLPEEWQDTTQLTQILVSRRGPQGQIAMGLFLVDLGCLGVKDALFQVSQLHQDYKTLRDSVKERQGMISADLNLAAKIIREAIAYADSLGFRPHRDYRQAKAMLGDADPDACDEEIPLGWEGKPLYVSGPYDNVDMIMAKLQRAVGPDGFDFLVGMDEPPETLFSDDVGDLDL
jgi:hypothetical protein